MATPETVAPVAPNEVGKAVDCSPKPLTSVCRDTSCPTLDTVELVCTDYGHTVRRATDCGGTAVTDDGGFSGAKLYFDADGKLMGIATWNDVPETCTDGSESIQRTYGTTCEEVGDPTDLCAEVCGGAPIECGDETGCPPTFIDLSVDACDAGGTVTSYTTSCGGTLATTITSDGSGRYFCFDPWNKLIGEGTQSEDGKRALTRGVNCEATGTPTDWCRKPG